MIYRLLMQNVPQQGGTRANKVYASRVVMGHTTTQMLADAVAYSTTLTPTDVKAVIDALLSEIRNRILQGQIVKLDGIGSLSLTILNNGGSSTLDAWTPELIKKAHVLFTADNSVGGLKNFVDANVTFTRWAGDTTLVQGDGPAPYTPNP
jgi:predicted histone-like DNA-binding protein